MAANKTGLAWRVAEHRPEFFIKFVVIGAPGSGKSALIAKYLDSSVPVHTQHFQPTIGPELHSKAIDDELVEDAVRYLPFPVRVNLLELPFSECRTQHNLPALLHSVQCVLLVVDLSNMHSVVAIDEWMVKLRQNNVTPTTTTFALFAHKSDNSRYEIPPQVLRKYAADIGTTIHFTSVQSQSMISNSLDEVVRAVLVRMKANDLFWSQYAAPDVDEETEGDADEEDEASLASPHSSIASNIQTSMYLDGPLSLDALQADLETVRQQFAKNQSAATQSIVTQVECEILPLLQEIAGLQQQYQPKQHLHVARNVATIRCKWLAWLPHLEELSAAGEKL
eukprot:TRINITY_DN95413_c0_g1_i1.p1 TRINITY_DN95413_c0_g1~~TRINITY_DN95413_c0_g1_i1.p1  ORF type:complete len:337 (+),score=19.22 TRINITY_DN95413_c0_g1_i1:28-1038(+)